MSLPDFDLAYHAAVRSVAEGRADEVELCWEVEDEQTAVSLTITVRQFPMYDGEAVEVVDSTE